MINKYFAVFIIATNFLTVLCSAETSQDPHSFAKEFSWANTKSCKIPSAPPPSKLMIHGLDFNSTSAKKSFRRWLDIDGDGICEIYDIKELQKSTFTQKIYGFPIRVYKLRNRRWKVEREGLDMWIPMVLMDKKLNQRILVDYVYGNAGYSPSIKGPPANCELLRKYLGTGFMLYYHFPEEAERDPLTNPEGEWNDVMSGWYSSQYTRKSEILASNLDTECKNKYRLVIDALAQKIER